MKLASERVTGVPGRIHAFKPDARSLFIKRHPVVRTISQHWYMVRFSGERRHWLTAIREDADYVETSHHATQLRLYLSLFGPARVLAITTESLAAARVEKTMAGIYGRLGVDRTFRRPTLEERANETPGVVTEVRGSGLLHQFRKRLANPC